MHLVCTLLIVSGRKKKQSQLWIPRKPRKIGVWVSGAEIQTSVVDTRTAVWVSTAEKFSKIVLGKARNSSRKFRGVSAPALHKNPAVIRTLVSCAVSDGVNVFGSGRPPRCPPGRPRDIAPRTLCLGCFSLPDPSRHPWPSET